MKPDELSQKYFLAAALFAITMSFGTVSASVYDYPISNFASLPATVTLIINYGTPDYYYITVPNVQSTVPGDPCIVSRNAGDEVWGVKLKLATTSAII